MISVIIPAWNARRWLPETLGSVMTQKGADFEVVLVDDGSTDGTGDYVAQGWPQVRLVRSENRGVSHARNLGTAHAHGEWIKYLDADDVLLPGVLARQAALLTAHPEADVVYGNWQRLEEQADGSFLPGELVRRSIEDVHEDPEMALFASFWCPTGAYLYRRSFLGKIMPWKEWLPVIQDARFAWDAAAAGARWVHDPQIAVLYRQHRTGSVSTRNQTAFLKDCIKNAVSIHGQWQLQSKPELLLRRKATVTEALAAMARQAASLDSELFLQSLQHLAEVCPSYKPNGKSYLALCSRLTSYSFAARLAGFMDLLRGRWRR